MYHPLGGLLVEARLGVVVGVVDADDFAALVSLRAGTTIHVLPARANPEPSRPRLLYERVPV